MNAFERSSPKSSETQSGVYTRDRLVPPSANRVDDASLESLVQRASSRPPRPLLPLQIDDDDDGGVVIPPLLPLSMTKMHLAAASVDSELTPVVTIAEPSLPPSVKAMILLPWTLLGAGAVAVAVLWPRGPEPVATESNAPIALGGASMADAFTLEEADALESTRAMTQRGVAPASQSRTVATREIRITDTRERGTARIVAPVQAPAAQAAQEAPPAPVAPVAEAAPAQASAVTTIIPAAPVEANSNVVHRMDEVLAHIESGATAQSGSAPAAAPTTIPDRPSRSEVAAALRRVNAAVDACTDQAGSVTIRIVVSNDGSVSSASATGAFAGTSEGVCMAAAVRNARFPQFTASSMTIGYPFVLH